MHALIDRFLKYVRIDTTPDESSQSLPSTPRQINFLAVLEKELKAMGLEEIHLDENGTLFATLPGGIEGETIALLAHVDTAPDAPGKNIKPVIHENWDGKAIELRNSVIIDPARSTDMMRYKGGSILTSDGTTLLGADDKAGVAVIMETCSRLLANSSLTRPKIRIAFTTDEEIGRGMDGFDTKILNADFAYTVDGGPMGRIDTQTFTAVSAVWKIKGREVQPGKAKGVMINAVRVAGDILKELLPNEMPEKSEGEEGYDYPMKISGTTASAEIKMLLRDFTSSGMEKRRERMKAILDKVQFVYPDAKIKLELKEQYQNPRDILKVDRRLIDYALEGSKKAGVPAVESSIRGGTDGSRLSFMGVPTVNLPTGGEQYHSRREWIAVEGMELSVSILFETLKIWGREIRCQDT